MKFSVDQKIEERVSQLRDYARFLDDNSFVIYLFHGVIPERVEYSVRNYTNKHLSVNDFGIVLNSLKQSGSAVSMPDIVAASTGQMVLPKKSFVITFDDGFLNNYSLAAPILDSFDISGTFYITTDFIRDNKSSWIDMIERAVEYSGGFEVKLSQIGLAGKCVGREEKIEFLDKVRNVVKNNKDIDPYEVAENICQQIGVEMVSSDVNLDEKMNWQQAKELSENSLFTVGGHGKTHRILSYLDKRELVMEIKDSLRELDEKLGFKVEHFSYPEGLSYCYSAEVIDMLRECGVVCSPSAVEGVNMVGDSLFHLKRVMVA